MIDLRGVYGWMGSGEKMWIREVLMIKEGGSIWRYFDFSVLFLVWKDYWEN